MIKAPTEKKAPAKLDLSRPPWINDVKEVHSKLMQNNSHFEQMQVDDSFFYNVNTNIVYQFYR